MEHVTAIITVYNGSKYLAETLESVQKQDYANLSTLVVDDGSTDDSVEIARKFPKTTVIVQKNAGPPAARNTGILAAGGGFLAFLDHDDLWATDKTSKQVEFLTKTPEIQFVGGWVEQFYTGDGVAPKCPYDKNKAYTQGALLIRKSDFLKVGLLNSDLFVGDFMDWRDRALLMGFQEHVLQQIVLYRRIHKASITKIGDRIRDSYMATVIENLKRKQKHEQSRGNNPL